MTRRVTSRVLPCSKCRRPLDLRFEFGVPEFVELGMRESVKLAFKCPDCGHRNERWTTDLVRYARTLGRVAAPDIVAGLAQLSHRMMEKAETAGKTIEASMAAQAAARLGKIVLEVGHTLTRKVEVEVREAPSEAARLDEVLDELVAEIRRRERGPVVDVEAVPGSGETTEASSATLLLPEPPAPPAPPPPPKKADPGARMFDPEPPEGAP